MFKAGNFSKHFISGEDCLAIRVKPFGTGCDDHFQVVAFKGTVCTGLQRNPLTHTKHTQQGNTFCQKNILGVFGRKYLLFPLKDISSRSFKAGGILEVLKYLSAEHPKLKTHSLTGNWEVSSPAKELRLERPADQGWGWELHRGGWA